MRALRSVTLPLIAAGTATTVSAVLLRDYGGGPSGARLSDCEALHAGALAQPVLAWTALALVVSGAWIVWTGDARDPVGAALFGVTTAAAGLASFTLHATAADGAGTWDAAAVAAVLAVLTLRIAGASWPVHLAAISTVAGVSLLAPSLLEPMGAAGVVTSVAALAATHRPSGRTAFGGAVAIALAGIGMTLWALGRTGGPLCAPGSVLQFHAGWHVLAGAALGAIHLHLRRGHGHTPGGALRSA